MEMNDGDNEEFGLSRNYFLAKELRGSGKRSHSKLSDIDVVDEQVMLGRLQFLQNLPFLLLF